MRYLLDLLPWLVLFLLVRSGIRSYLANSRRTRGVPPGQQSSPSVSAGGELKKDPVCGTYVSPAAAVSRTVNGQIVYFCSAQCRDKHAG
jgi:YHS domain-containing protein